MKRLLEWIFGLDRGFLNQEGDLSIQFHPRWPGQDALDYLFTRIGFGPVGAAAWTATLALAAIALVIYVYRREGRSKGARVSLAAIALLIRRFYRFYRQAIPVVSLASQKKEGDSKDDSTEEKRTGPDYAPVLTAFERLKPEGQTTQVLASLRSAIEDLQGQRLAGVVLLT